MLLFFANKKQLIVSVLIASVALVGDKNSENQSDRIVAAICDNVTHGFIGALSWVGTFITKTSSTDIYFIIEILLCGLCSSIIDADHFIAARSLNLKDATSLKSRPFLHCTTFCALLVTFIFLCAVFFKLSWLYKFGWILTIAFLSHHIRDSKRRGFWLWPFGHTNPTPYFLYMTLQMFLPQIFSLIILKCAPSEIFRNEKIHYVETV